MGAHGLQRLLYWLLYRGLGLGLTLHPLMRQGSPWRGDAIPLGIGRGAARGTVGTARGF